MTFDERGNLKPYQIIETNLLAVEQTLDIDFPDSSTRKGLLANFKELCELVHQHISSSLRVWIDGSFVTKQLNPKGIVQLLF